MKKALFLALFFGVATSAAFADTVVQNCLSPTEDANPPSFGNMVSACPAGFQDGLNSLNPAIIPGGSILNSIKLFSRYSISLELGENSGTAKFRHTTNAGVTDFDNTIADLVTHPLQDNQWGGGADIPGGVFSCAGGNAATCAAIVAAMNAGTVSITTYFTNAAGGTSGVSADYAWIIDYTPSKVPEPASLTLLGLGALALGIGRRFVRR